MQIVPGFPTDLTSVALSAEVRINGVAASFESVSVQSDLQSAMPSHVAAAGGAAVASTGDATILPGADVVASPAHPWNGSAPAQMASVEVDAGYDGAVCRVFTGTIDSVSGAPSSAGVDVGLIDAIDRLDRKVTWEPLLNAAPSLTEGDWTFRRAGLNPTHITDKALRHCGFYATPQASGNVVFSAPMMGSAWPEKGTLVTARAHSDPNASAAWRKTPWGVALGNGILSYAPSPSSGDGRMNATFQMVFCRAEHTTLTDSATWDVKWGTNSVRVWMPADGRIVALALTNGVESGRLTMTAVSAATADTFTVRWLTSGNMTIYASNGSTVTGTVPLPAGISTSPMTTIEINHPQAAYMWGGLQASFSTFQAHTIPRTAVLTPPALLYGLLAFPAVRDRSCAEILKEQAEAELAAMWIDEYGVFRWVNRDILTGTTPAGTLTSTAHLMDLPWEMPPKSVYSKASVISSSPTITRRAKSNLKVWQGSSGTLENLDADTEIITPDGNEDWHQVASPLRTATANVNDVKYGRGSYMGGILVQDGVEARWATTTELAQAFARLPGGQYKITSAAALTGGTDVVEQRIFGTEYGSYHGADLPILRAKAKAVWDEKTTTGAVVGPAGGPELQHPVGPWIQDDAELVEFVNWLAVHVTTSAPIVRDVPIVPDPRIQKGDVLWLEDTDKYRVRLKVLVMGTSLTVSAGPPMAMDQSITCRIISVERPWVTLAEHDEVWKGDTLTAHDAFWAGKTLAQQDAEPLKHP